MNRQLGPVLPKVRTDCVGLGLDLIIAARSFAVVVKSTFSSSFRSLSSFAKVMTIRYGAKADAKKGRVCQAIKSIWFIKFNLKMISSRAISNLKCWGENNQYQVTVN